MIDKFYSLLGFSSQRHSLLTEFNAGLTTFASMMYILPLNLVMFSPLQELGYPLPALYTATALTAIIGTLLMAFVARRPFGVAPGWSFNIFFVQTMCISLGYSWQFALTAVLLEGIIFTILCFTKSRSIVFGMLPPSLRYSIAAGIGLTIAEMGFRNSGLLADGTIFSHLETLSQPPQILFIIGLVLIAFLTVLKVRGAMLLSVLLTALIGIPLGVTEIPSDFISKPISPAPLFCQFTFDALFSADMWVCVSALLFFDVFDTLSTTTGIMANAGLVRKNGRLPFQQDIMLSDALATVSGACLGCSTATTFLESSNGVAAGGRTGMTALFIALGFVATLFLAPFFLSIPNAASMPLMVIAGFFLFSSIRHVDFKNPVEAMPAFCTIVIMAMTGNISDGIVSGVFAYGMLSLLDNYWKHKNDHLD